MTLLVWTLSPERGPCPGGCGLSLGAVDGSVEAVEADAQGLRWISTICGAGGASPGFSAPSPLARLADKVMVCSTPFGVITVSRASGNRVWPPTPLNGLTPG